VVFRKSPMLNVNRVCINNRHDNWRLFRPLLLIQRAAKNAPWRILQFCTEKDEDSSRNTRRLFTYRASLPNLVSRCSWSIDEANDITLSRPYKAKAQCHNVCINPANLIKISLTHFEMTSWNIKYRFLTCNAIWYNPASVRLPVRHKTVLYQNGYK